MPPKNIVICSDGTGNRGGVTRGTNVWRIFNAVDRYGEQPQIACYDDGVGSAGRRWLRLLSGAVGWGLSRNIREAYEFLAMNYEEGDQIFLFGYSRGGFTVRSLAGMVNRCGLLRYKPEDERNCGKTEWEKKVRRVFKAYRMKEKVLKRRECALLEKGEEDPHKRRAFALGIEGLETRQAPIHFVGVWDTVDAVGLPFAELKRCIQWFVDLLPRKRRLWHFNDDYPSGIANAFQALALDDERLAFHPKIWNERGMDENAGQVVEQVWFAGAHANVGGGLPKDSLALIALDWMMGKAEACGLRFLAAAREEVQNRSDAHGRYYDSRKGFGAFYRPSLRKPGCDAVRVHTSVFERMERLSNRYVPKIVAQDQAERVYTDRGPFSAPDD